MIKHIHQESNDNKWTFQNKNESIVVPCLPQKTSKEIIEIVCDLAKYGDDVIVFTDDEGRCGFLSLGKINIISVPRRAKF